MPSFFNDGNTPARSDGMWKIEQKILGALVASSSIGGANELMHGSGPPSAAPSTPGSPAIYYDDDDTSPSYGVTWPWNVNTQAWVGV